MGMVVSPDNKTVYGMDQGSDYGRLGERIRALDTETNTTIDLPGGGSSIAITPDGSTLLAASQSANAVTPFATATNQPGEPITVDRPEDLAIAPDGRTAYVLTGGGTLTPIDLTTRTAGAPIALAHPGTAIAITPDGALGVVAQSEGNAGFLQVVDLTSGMPEAPVPVPTPQPLSDLVMAPDGSTAYVSTQPVYGFNPGCCPRWPAALYAFAIATRTVGPAIEGSWSGRGIAQFALTAMHLYQVIPNSMFGFVLARTLSPLGADTILLGGEGDKLGPLGLVVGPSPAASFTVEAAATGASTTFDAVASHNDGGSIASYRWDFGDGTIVTTGVATASHRYANPGTYTVKLTTTNTGGCAARLVYTGHSATCSGVPTASTTRTVTIVTPGASATTSRASGLTTTAATLNGTVGATPGQADWHFEYGETTRYGQNTPAVRGTGAVKATITGLKPNTTYHYRLVAATDRGTPPVSSGADLTFKTAATGTLRLQAKTLRLRGTSVNVALRCQSSVACRGTLTLTSGKRTCATGTVRLKANQRAHKRLTVRSSCRRTRSGRLTSTVTTGQKTFAAAVRIKR